MEIKFGSWGIKCSSGGRPMNEGLAEIELRAFVRVLVLGPLEAVRADDPVRVLRSGTIVAVTDVVLDDVVDPLMWRPRWSARLANAVARHDDLFHALFD
jgi:hypothetical protein